MLMTTGRFKAPGSGHTVQGCRVLSTYIVECRISLLASYQSTFGQVSEGPDGRSWPQLHSCNELGGASLWRYEVWSIDSESNILTCHTFGRTPRGALAGNFGPKNVHFDL